MKHHHQLTSVVGILVLLLLVTIGMVTCQQSGPISFTLEEGVRADTLVGNVAEKSGLRDDVTPEVFQGLEFQILSSEGLRIASLFSINSRTGALFTNAMIDREQVCDVTAVVCTLQFDVTARNGVDFLKLLNVVVTVTDKNDNPPEFPNPELSLSISEAAPVGSEMSVSGAIDRDGGLNTTISYWMDNSGVFRLTEVKLLDVSELKVILTRELDRETESAYRLNIYAKDGDSDTALTGTLAVTITVTDVNDHKPEFALPVFNFTVQESADVGSPVGQLQARDPDQGANGEISFHFSPLTSAEVGRLFALDESSGLVTVRAPLQYESGRKFQAVVEAKDKGGSPWADQAILVLHVEDTGNTPPRVSITLADPLYAGSTLLPEDLPPASFVGTLKYEDNDLADNGRVSCASLNSNFDLRPLEDHAYAIEVKVQLDREAQSEMVVVLRCSDGGSPSLWSAANFTVLVGDVNDNAPVFRPADYTAMITEGVRQSPNLVRVSAIDADEDVNSELSYQLSANSSNAFSVDPLTGWISLTLPVDREAGPIIPLTALAVDNGQPRLTATAMVSVYVQDINDNRPEIVRLQYETRENQKSGTFVSQIVGADSDAGLNGELSYRLLEDPSGGFSVSESGVISTAMSFDREKVDHYTIMVEVSDRGPEPLSSTATLTITVTDANDHRPAMVWPVPGNDSVTVSAGLSPGSLLARAEARDLDLGRNARLLYQIAEGDPHSMFGMDNRTGAIFLARRLTSRRESTYRLTISVQDAGSPRLHSQATLYLHVDFSNATRLGDSRTMERKYVVIAGVIAGFTLVIAVIVVAVILKLRHMDITQCAGRGAKVKAVDRGMGQPPATVPVKHSGHLAVPAGGAYRGDQGDREAGFGDIDLHKTYMDGHMTRDFNQTTHTNQGVAVPSAPPLQARPPPGNEDMISDSSADVTTSDSGRGASDTEEAPSTGGGHLYGSTSSSLDPVGRSATGQTFTTPGLGAPGVAGSSFTPGPGQEGPTRLLGGRDSASMGGLPSSARAYASQKHFQKPRRPFGKVRFSVDDQLVGEGQAQGAGRDAGQVYWTGERRGPDVLPSRMPSTFSWQGQQGQPGQDKQIELSSSANPSRQFNGANSNPSASGHPYLSQHLPNTRNTNHSSVPQQTKPPQRPSLSSSTSSSSSHPDLFLTSSSSTGLRPPPNKPARPSRLAPPTPGFPLLPQHRYQPPTNRGLLPTLNASLDEDDDDGGSTTTSGSYAVDDNVLNLSVEC